MQPYFFFLPVGHPAGLDGFVGCIDLTYLRDSLTNIRIRVLSPGRPSLGRMPHSPYYFFRGGVHISLLCPPSTCVCMCAVNTGGCVIDLFVQGWASTSSLLCLVKGNSANTDNSPVPTSPFCIPPYQAFTPTRDHPFLCVDSDTPLHQVAVYDTLGIRRTFLNHPPPPPPGLLTGDGGGAD